MSLPPMITGFDERIVRNDVLSSSVTYGDGALFGPPVSRGPGPAVIETVTLSQIEGQTSRGWYTITGRALTGVTQVVFTKHGIDDRISQSFRNRSDTSLEVWLETDLASSGPWYVELEGPNGTVQASLESGVFVSGVWIYGIAPAGVQDSASARQYSLTGVGMDYVTSVEILAGGTVAAKVAVDSQIDAEVLFTLREPLPAATYNVRVQPQGKQRNGCLTITTVPVAFTSLTPSSVAAAASVVEFVAAGSGLAKVNEVQLFYADTGKYAYTMTLTYPLDTTGTEVRFTPASPLRAGVYDVALSHSQGAYPRLAAALTVTP